MNPANLAVDSALHVLKGAVQRILNTSVTTAVFAERNNGRLTVEYGGFVTEQQLQLIENLSNEKIKENITIEKFEMDRANAETQFGNTMYDKFPVPISIRRLTITRIKDWNINCCLGPHFKTTAEIGKITITKHRNRSNRKELEISFEIDNLQQKDL